MRNRDSSRLTLFPGDMIPNLASYLHLQGPKVVPIIETPTDIQKSDVMARGGESKTLDLSRYHLIKKTTLNNANKVVRVDFHIGFCKLNGANEVKYETFMLSEKSPLQRYIKQYPFILEKGEFRDRELIKYIEEEIIAAQGLTFDWLQSFKQLVTLSDLSESPRFKEIVRQELLKEIHHLLMFCECEPNLDNLGSPVLKARALLELDPELVSSCYRIDVPTCAPELKFLKTTLLEQTLMNGFWPGWEMILDVVQHSKRLTNEERTRLLADLANQYKRLKQMPNTVELDTLLLNGVRIWDATVWNDLPPVDKKARLDTLVERHAFYLIINTTEAAKREADTCELIYSDPKTKQCLKYVLSNKQVYEHALFALAGQLDAERQVANDGFGNTQTHFVTRDPHVLMLVRKLLMEELKEPICTVLKKPRSRLELDDLINALKNRQERFRDRTWTPDRLQEDWHVTISTLLRLLPSMIFRLWLRKGFSVTKAEQIKSYVLSAAYGELHKCTGERSLFPLPALLGDKFYAMEQGWLSWGLGVGGPAPFLFSTYLECVASKMEHLERCLTGQPEPEQSSSKCQLM